MTLDHQYDRATGIFSVTFSGILKREEFTRCEELMKELIDAGEVPRVLCGLKNFAGWEKGEDWNTMDFMFSYGNQIAKIAIVGAGNKEAEVKAFTGAGLRKTPVQIYAAEELEAAKAWLMEP